jgi:mRNA-degrading endonuclease toxin of MazEF toxin-antitoxin module
MEYPTPPAARKNVRDPHMVVLLSWDAGMRIRDRVTLAPLTRTERGLDAEVRLSPSMDGVPDHCVINLDIIATVLYSQLTRKQTLLSHSKIREVDIAIHRALGITLPCAYSLSER